MTLKKNIRNISMLASLSLIPLVFSISALADDSEIPTWVKNNAMWWAEGSISESDYVKSLEYLITHGIIQVPIPITEVTASAPLNDDERAQSFVVRFHGGFLPETFTTNTFSKYSVISKTTNPSDPFYHIYKFGESQQFLLESLPSKDKRNAYAVINKWIQDEPLITQQFKVDIDVIAGDGTTLQSWRYGNCDLTGYGTYLQDITNFYSFSNVEQAEIRDRWIFSCSDVALIVP